MDIVLIAEDDKEINKLLSTYLSELGYHTISVYSGLEAVDRIRENHNISIMLLDLMLPFLSGDRVIEKVRDISNVPIIVISAKDMVQTKIDIIRLGADDYITKPFDLDEVLVRIEAVLRRTGNIVFDNYCETYSYKKLILNDSAKTVEVNKKQLVLTNKEFEIIKLLVINPTKLFSKANIFESVWNEVYYNEDSTLKVHMSNIRNKIKEADSEEEYIETVWGMGYRLYKN